MKRQFTIFSLLMIIAVIASACATPTTEAPKPTVAPTAVPQPTAAPKPTDAPKPTEAPKGMDYTPAKQKGNIVTAGSSTVFPISQRMADLFKKEGYSGNITVDSIGTGAGFERFCKTGETDISNASRAIKDAEKENCKKINREPVEFYVAIDALAVVVSTENDFAKNLTKNQLTAIYSGKAAKWSDVDPKFPAEGIKLFSPGTDSGTFDYFIEATAVKKEDILKVPGIQLSENDNVLVKGVEGSKYAIGYFGYAYYAADKGKLRAVSIEGVEPSKETVEGNKYPLARPIFIYSDAKIMKDKPQVAAFIKFYLDNLNKEVAKVGYFPPPAADQKKTMDVFNKAVGVMMP